MSLSGFEIAVGGITSIPLTSSLVLLLYKALGEKQLDTTKLKVKKVVAKAMPATPKKEKGDDKIPESLKSK
jgi:hypothetical protein